MKKNNKKKNKNNKKNKKRENQTQDVTVDLIESRTWSWHNPHARNIIDYPSTQTLGPEEHTDCTRNRHNTVSSSTPSSPAQTPNGTPFPRLFFSPFSRVLPQSTRPQSVQGTDPTPCPLPLLLSPYSLWMEPPSYGYLFSPFSRVLPQSTRPQSSSLTTSSQSPPLDEYQED